MHRTIEITAPSAMIDSLLSALSREEHVVGVSRQRGVSVQPPDCDVVVVHALNRGTDAVLLSVAQAAARHPGPYSVATAELASLSDPDHQHAIDRDVDEALWEEMEAGLRHQGRVTPNFVALMALGGAIAAAGLFAHSPAEQVIASIAAAILAPGFEPLAKLPLGLVLRRFEVVKLGLISTLAGYAALMAGGAAAYGVLHVVGAADPAALLASPLIKQLADPPATDLVVSVCGAFAGLVITAAYRNSVIAGALVAMRLIDAAAAVGVGLAAGSPGVAAQALQRFGLDAALIAVAGVVVVSVKQRFTHQRTPLH
jgi:Domain of unknown function (DUF389)